MPHNNKRVVLVGGGTAGHVIPLLAVAEKLRGDYGSYSFVFIGSGDDIEKKLVAKKRIKYKKNLCGKYRRDRSISSIVLNFIDIFKTGIGICTAIIYLLRNRPNIVFSKGGYVSLPVVVAAGILRIPIVSHESDIVIGLANKITLKYTSLIATAFPISFYGREVSLKAIYSGIPLREEFDENKKTYERYVLIMGGSSGAKKLNEIFFEIGESVLKKHEVIHLTGKSDYDRAISFRKSLKKSLQKKYIVKDFSENMADLIKDSKLVISRAGATSIFEIATFSKKAILVPISSDVGGHQTVNAKSLEKMGLVKTFYQNQAPQDLLELINTSMKEEFSLEKLSFPKSSQLLAKIIDDFIKNEELKKIRNVFMIGVSGVSMRGVKYILEKMGKSVEGSDIKIGGHSRSNIGDDLDLVIYTSAAKKGSPGYVEIQEANKKGIETIKRSEMIGRLLKGKKGVTITGMHGKTTVSMLLSRIFEADNRDPSYLVGAPYYNNNPSYSYGKGSDFVVEACEYDGSFLEMNSFAGVITNIEEEHMDYFKNLDDIKEQFSKYTNNIYCGGALAYCSDDENTKGVIESLGDNLKQRNISLYSYGFSDGSIFRIKNYKFNNGCASFKIEIGVYGFEVITKVAGKHFALNATAAFIIAFHYGINPELILSVIADFEGAARRMELVANEDGMYFYDDYAHHPTEIMASLNAIDLMYPKRRKIIIFEPHQQERFDEHYNDYIKSLSVSKPDLLAVLPIYRVPGRDKQKVKDSSDLVKDIDRKNCVFIENYQSGIRLLRDNLKKGDIVLTMGATDVYKIIYGYLEKDK